MVNAADRVVRAPKRCDYTIYAQAAVQTEEWPPSSASVIQQYYVPGPNATVDGQLADRVRRARPAVAGPAPTDLLVQRVTIQITSPDGKHQSQDRGGEVRCLTFVEHASAREPIRQRGMTLLELVVAISMLGLLMTVLSSADHRHTAPAGQHRGSSQRRGGGAERSACGSRPDLRRPASSTRARRRHRAAATSVTAST